MTTRLLTLSNLYPNAMQPGLGQFVETRLNQLLRDRDYEARVIAPVPWFPVKASMFGEYGVFAGVPKSEVRNDVPVQHPRYLHFPKVGMHTAPILMGRSAIQVAHAMARDGFTPDLVDAHYFYPDGVAAARLAAKLDKPLMITARGSDINLITQFPRPLRLMREAAAQSAAIVAVSSALANRMSDLGFGADKIHVVRNGVDLDFFTPASRIEARASLQVSGRVLLSVGNLVELKGHHLIIDAVSKLPDTTLLIAGSGIMQSDLEAQIARLGLDDRVRLVGQRTREELRTLYAAADMLVLASSREGLANVLLEAIASGLPVVATNVGGNGEVVCDPRAGVLADERSPEALIRSIQHISDHGPSREETRKFAYKFGWNDACHTLHGLIQRIISH
ncbi:MAG: glycosyltransferase [Gammaproteobacteria bacterium]